jgi:hypothetical protein
MPTTGEVHAIETHYAGCRFRSRLEARWAVFFDKMKIAWEYEPQGYRVGGTPYLPDFWLPELRQWVEVKGSALSPREQAIMARAVQPGSGLPENENGVLLLGPIPDVRGSRARVLHPRFRFANAALYRGSFCWSGGNDDPHLELVIESGGHSVLSPKNVTAWSPAARIHNPGRRSTAAERRVAKAYVAARSARFEHGERG